MSDRYRAILCCNQHITLFGPNFRRFSGPNLSLALFVYRLIGAILKVFYEPFLKLN